MKFEMVDTRGVHIHSTCAIKYVVGENSFAYDYKDYFQDFSLAVNTLELSIDDNFFLSGVSGYDSYVGWKPTYTYQPSFKKGGVRAVIDFDYVPGCVYDIDPQKVWPEYVNIKSGWVCIGDPEGAGKAVEFINNCVAVIDNSQELVALWLKPQPLPKLKK
jgi:hypothetical protein